MGLNTLSPNPRNIGDGLWTPGPTWNEYVESLSPWAWWKLDDGDRWVEGAAVAGDASGNGRTGTFNGDQVSPTRWTDPLVQGSRSAVTADSTAAFQLRSSSTSFVTGLTAGSFTFGLLLKSSATATIRRLVQATSGFTGLAVFLNYPASGDMRFYYDTAGSDANALTLLSSGWNDGSAHLLMFEYDGVADTLSIWMDGTEAATRSRAGTKPSGLSGTFDWLFRPTTGVTATDADEYLFFTRTLTSTEHADLASFTRPGTHPYGASWSPPYNTASHLEIPVPGLSSTEAMHPDVVDFGTTWNGYRYWMAFTPYNGDFNTEEPCIVATNDIVTDDWEVPSGFTNPITADPAGNEHTADADLLYDASADRLYVFYVRSDRSTFQDIRSKWTDGDGTWSTETTVLTGPDGGYSNPSIIPTGSGWRLYYTDSDADLCYRDSSTAPDSGYGSETVCTGTSPVYWANINMAYDTDGSTVCVLSDSVTTSGLNGRLFFLRSADGDDFELVGPPVLEPQPSEWDRSGIYRCSVLTDTDGVIVVDGDEIDVWYSGFNAVPSPDEWGTAHIQLPVVVLRG